MWRVIPVQIFAGNVVGKFIVAWVADLLIKFLVHAHSREQIARSNFFNDVLLNGESGFHGI